MLLTTLSKKEGNCQAIVNNNFKKDDRLRFVILPVHRDFNLDVGAYILECDTESTYKDISGIFNLACRKLYDMLSAQGIVRSIR